MEFLCSLTDQNAPFNYYLFLHYRFLHSIASFLLCVTKRLHFSQPVRLQKFFHTYILLLLWLSLFWPWCMKNSLAVLSDLYLRRLERVFLVAIVFVKRWKIPKKDNSKCSQTINIFATLLLGNTWKTLMTSYRLPKPVSYTHLTLPTICSV